MKQDGSNWGEARGGEGGEREARGRRETKMGAGKEEMRMWPKKIKMSDKCIQVTISQTCLKHTFQ